MEKGDCAILTAFRRRNDDGEIIPLVENRERNQRLLSDLRDLGYGPHRLHGAYDEEILDKDGKGTGQTERVQEESWFVPELYGDESALTDILNLGSKYDQDAILHIIHPIEREEEHIIEAVIIGTSDRSFIGNKETIPIGALTMIKIGDIYSKIGKHRFAFHMNEMTEAEAKRAKERLMRPEGLVNAYAKREILKKRLDLSAA